MQAPKPGFEATGIKERYSRQRKEQNYKQQKAKRKVCLDRSNHVLLGFSVFEGEQCETEARLEYFYISVVWYIMCILTKMSISQSPEPVTMTLHGRKDFVM